MGIARKWLAATVIDDLLYVVGGSDGSSALSSGERYDPALNAWSPIASMGTARNDHAAVAIDGMLYAIGGGQDSDSSDVTLGVLSSGERYDPAVDAWSPIASMGTARADFAAVVL